MKHARHVAIDFEDIPFVADTSLDYSSQTLTDEEIMLIAATLFEIVPPDRHTERMWARAARLTGVSRRELSIKEQK